VTRTYSQERYLAAKRTVDDRSLNRQVLDELTPLLADSTHVVEIGAGIGTMLRRLLEWDLLPDRVTYTLVDVDANSIAAARDRLPSWASSDGYTVIEDDSIVLRRDGQEVRVETAVEDAATYLATESPDIVIGVAVLDLLDAAEVDELFAQLSEGCHCYFPITFDGDTAFQPTVFPAFDEHVIERYHEDMHRRENPGDPHAGRHLLSRAANDHILIASGASDWVVAPEDSGYRADETYFLHHVIETVQSALVDDPAVDDDQLDLWADNRHEQIARGELVYIAHQLDVLLTV